MKKKNRKIRVKKCTKNPPTKKELVKEKRINKKNKTKTNKNTTFAHAILQKKEKKKKR